MSEDFNKANGEKLKEMREDRGLSQREAAKSGVYSDRSILNIEKGATDPNIGRVEEYANTLGYKVLIRYIKELSYLKKMDDEIIVPGEGPDSQRRIKVKSIRIVEADKNIENSIINEILNGDRGLYISSPLESNNVSIQLFEMILGKKLFRDVDSLKDKAILIEIDEETTTETNSFALQRIMHGLFNLRKEEYTYSERSGSEIGFRGMGVFDFMTRDGNKIQLNFSNSNADSFKNDLEEIIKKKIECLKNDNNRLLEFIEENPSGFPFLCGVWRDADLFKAEVDEIFSFDNDYDCLGIQIVNAFSDEDARKKYIERNYSDLDDSYFEETFTKDVAIYLWYDELDEFSENHYPELSKFVDKYYPIEGVDDENFAVILGNKYTPEQLYEIIGKEVYDKFLRNNCEIEVFAKLDRYHHKLYDLFKGQ